MMALGGYRFGVSTAAYRELTRAAEYRWAAQERLGRLPARQYLGPGSELSGVIHPLILPKAAAFAAGGAGWASWTACAPKPPAASRWT